MTMRVLFVDDETQVLDSLRDLLHRHRRQWDMDFAPGGPAALEAMARAPFDVVVSDLRMPGMDGAALLDAIRATHPGTARIVLSGHADQALVLKVLPLSQQYLSKPCDAAALRAVIERAAARRVLLPDPGLRAMVGGIDRLSWCPDTVTALARTLAGRDTAAAAIGGVVARDPALCATILQLANSALFGPSQPVVSIDRAVGYLGVEFIAALAGADRVFPRSEPAAPPPGVPLGAFHADARLTATIASRIVRDPARADEACTAGLLHDVGTLVFAHADPVLAADLWRDAARSGRALHVVERDRLGTSHAEIGACLLDAWGLPPSIVTAVAQHHAPAVVPAEDTDLVVAVHVASALAAERSAHEAGTHDAPLDLQALDALGVSDALAHWRDVADRAYARGAAEP
jgi:HD-like signal output (HDOD) protein/CheY-like chemotaxis protein